MGYAKTPLTVTQINKYLKNLLENDIQLKQLYLVGEVSNVKYHSNGNIYFSIKDKQAQINCIMFKNYTKSLNFKLIEGDQVELLGSIYLYSKMGQYNLNIIKIRKTGLGDLYQKFLELKKKLDSEGWFAENRKQQLPEFPHKIGVITSPTGAAIRDIISTIQRRYQLAKIVIIPTLVQGGKAAPDIANNIKRANLIGGYDLLIVGRGGGSIEDLWAFNEMETVQAIIDSQIPIISAVGHEPDFTIADFVADKRAPTPTAAAEIATPDIEQLKLGLAKNVELMQRNLQSKIDYHAQQLKLIKNNQYFKNPLLNLEVNFDLLTRAINNQSEILATRINNYHQNLQSLNEQSQINIKNLINGNQTKIKHQKENLDNLNPLNILSKGYNTVQKEQKYIKSINDLEVNDKLDLNLNDGQAEVEVIKINKKNKEDKDA